MQTQPMNDDAQESYGENMRFLHRLAWFMFIKDMPVYLILATVFLLLCISPVCFAISMMMGISILGISIAWAAVFAVSLLSLPMLSWLGRFVFDWHPGLKAGCPALCSLIDSRCLTYQQASNLTFQQYECITNEQLNALIRESLIDIDQVIELTDQECECLRGRITNAHVYALIRDGLIDIAQVFELTDQQCECIPNEQLNALIRESRIDIAQVLQFTDQQCECITNEHVCELMRVGRINIAQVLRLTDSECECLRERIANKQINALMSSPRINIAQVLRLTDPEYERLCKCIMFSNLYTMVFSGLIDITRLLKFPDERISAILVDGAHKSVSASAVQTVGSVPGTGTQGFFADPRSASASSQSSISSNTVR